MTNAVRPRFSYPLLSCCHEAFSFIVVRSAGGFLYLIGVVPVGASVNLGSSAHIP